MIGKPDSGKKAKVPDHKAKTEMPKKGIGLHSARGGQSNTRPTFRASETKNKPVTGGGKRSVQGTSAGSKNTAPGMGGAPRSK